MGPLRLRAGHAAWIDARALRPENRSGRLARAPLERARFLVATPAAAATGEPPLDEELAGWWAELDAARAALLAASPASERRWLGGSLPAPRLLGLAAAALLVVSAVLTGRLGQLSATVDRLERTRQRDAAALGRAEEARRGADARANGLAAALTAESAAAARAGEARAPQPLVNVPFLWLTPAEAVRGEAPVLALPASGELVVLIVPLVEPARFDRYRVELVRGAEVVWQSSDLVPTGIAELSIALPRSLLPPGGYRLRVSGLRARGAEALATFRFVVAPAPRPASTAQRQSP
jgi:hypothetical protein